MATSKEKAEEILAQIQTVTEARIRPMMGEYLLYIHDKLVGQINENELFIKVTQFGEDFAGDLEKRAPYPGAKSAFLVPADKISDQAWLRDFIAGTFKQLPSPKKR